MDEQEGGAERRSPGQPDDNPSADQSEPLRTEEDASPSDSTKPETGNSVYRSWNERILPGYEVVAIDESHPGYAGEQLAVPDERPPYPSSEQLLGDPAYVRYERIKLQSILAWGINDREVAHAEFRQWLKSNMGYFRERLSAGDESSNGALSFFEAIERDFQDEPDAVFHKLN